MIVSWTESARSDLQGIHKYISADSVHYATAVVDRLTTRCTQLAAFPRSGQIVPEYHREDIREVFVYSYRMIYLVDNTAIWILAVIHGAKPLPSILSISSDLK